MFNLINGSNLRGDILGGLTAAIVSLPLALTFGVASGAGAEAGLYGAVLVGLFAALFGGTPTLISEPTGPMTVIMAAVVSSTIAANPENGLAMAFTVVMIAGAFQIMFGALRLGKYITLMPYSVVSGFMSGIGFILIIMQLAPLTGHSAPPGGATGMLLALPELIKTTNPVEVLLGLATLCIIFLSPNRIKKYVPPQLIALVAISLVSVFFLSDNSINRIGEINVSLPSIQLPVFTAAQLQTMMLDGMILGMLGCIDSMLTSVIADNLTRTEHKSDKELIGQGIGNIFSGLFGGLPGAGATMGTVVNIQSGARTALSGVVRVVVLIIAVFGAAQLLESIPLAVLAGIAIKVGLDILDWSFIKRAHRVSWQSTAIMYLVLLLTLFVDLIVAVGLGVFIANIMTIEKLSRAQEGNIKAISDMDDKLPLNREQRALMNAANGRILLLYLSGPMIFGVAKALAREQAALKDCDAVIVDLTDVSFLDDTISLAIENVIKEAVESLKEVYVITKQKKVQERMLRMGMEDIISEHRFIDNRTEALRLASFKLGIS
ncbi:SulP family inorganic anion transporter [Aestuariibacter salexigens]|uniref:SulP family inorganic anion transporter n=1 Tax=Aestuariibacter salexigens TaxID=226010 RepID=UPI0004074D7F|nr:SulP family inorganic anion transporter [Aestuariibacter salexigens]